MYKIENLKTILFENKLAVMFFLLLLFVALFMFFSRKCNLQCPLKKRNDVDESMKRAFKKKDKKKKE